MILETNERLTPFFNLLTEHRNTIYVATPLEKYQRFLSRAFVERLSSTEDLLHWNPISEQRKPQEKFLFCVPLYRNTRQFAQRGA